MWRTELFMFAFGLNSDFQDDDWCCKNSPKMLVNAFHLPSWKWLFLGNPARFIRNPNHLAAFCPEPSLQLLIICYVSWFCPFLIVKVAATSSFHLGWYCCIDACRGSFLWSLQKQKKTNKTKQFRQGRYSRRITLWYKTLPGSLFKPQAGNDKNVTHPTGRVCSISTTVLFWDSLKPQNRYIENSGPFFQELVKWSILNNWFSFHS